MEYVSVKSRKIDENKYELRTTVRIPEKPNAQSLEFEKWFTFENPTRVYHRPGDGFIYITGIKDRACHP